jgi:CheY-like chemotaxis protein
MNQLAGKPADPPSGRIADVLLVEDDPGDVLLTTEAFETFSTGYALHVVNDGQQAMQFLQGADEYSSAPRPSLILLDLNLPRRSGLEVLAEVKASERLLAIPVVVLTTSRADEDIRASYELHANAYITKPTDVDLYIDAIRQVDSFFLTLAQRPGLGPAAWRARLDAAPAPAQSASHAG